HGTLSEAVSNSCKCRKQHRFCACFHYIAAPSKGTYLACTKKQGGNTMPSTRTIQANGIELFVREEGQGPLVVLCHGWPELSYSWRHQIPALAAAGFHVAAPDMRGFGRTTAPADIDAYSIFDSVGDMVA